MRSENRDIMSKSHELGFPCVDPEGKPCHFVLTLDGDQVTLAVLPDSAGSPRISVTASAREMRRVAHSILSALGPHPVDRDRRFELACFAISGLAPEFHKSGADENADDIAKRAVELADATVRALGSVDAEDVP